MNAPTRPAPFLNVLVHDLSVAPGLTGLCVGYEREEWRSTQFATHILEWLSEFALKHSELSDLNSGNAVQMIRDAAKRVYESKKFKNRGEFGELFLHAAIRQVFNSLPAISKIYYKTARNETVKGFDAVHVVVNAANELELWLGEAKFYNEVTRAVRDVVAELQHHTQTNYLRDEFLLIKGKIDSAWPHAKALEGFLSSKKSLDEVFSKACIAVLLTYDSDCLAKYRKSDAAYKADFEVEIRKHYAAFAGKKLPDDISIHLFLLPLHTKAKLLKALDEQLKAWQTI
ncbi:MAG TPA: DUF1837 domain-containing protein [Opitutaceae bacterium]|nr:DUF1837 domain-containing protein [Opitutaceae bacterium]